MEQKKTKNPKSSYVEEDSPDPEDVVGEEAEVVRGVEEQYFDEVAPVPKESKLSTPSPDEDLTPAQKLEFVKLIRNKMSLEERAERLATLARMHGTKTAAVGLRAIQHMNELDGFSDDESTEAPPLFRLPEDTQVAVAIKMPKK